MCLDRHYLSKESRQYRQAYVRFPPHCGRQAIRALAPLTAPRRHQPLHRVWGQPRRSARGTWKWSGKRIFILSATTPMLPEASSLRCSIASNPFARRRFSSIPRSKPLDDPGSGFHRGPRSYSSVNASRRIPRGTCQALDRFFAPARKSKQLNRVWSTADRVFTKPASTAVEISPHII